MIQKILDGIKNQPMTISQWVAGFLCVVFVRFILETFSNQTSSGVAPSDPYTLVHYGLFFLTALLGLICIVGYFNRDYVSTGKVLLFGLPAIWLAPVLDLIISAGKGYKMTYIMDSHGAMFRDIFKFWSPQFMQGATYGIRIEILIMLCGIGLYVWISKRNILKSLLAVLSSYIFILILALIPGILYTLTHLSGAIVSNQSTTLNYMLNLVINSNILHNTLHESFTSVTPLRFMELGFDKLLTQILLIFSVIFASIWFWKIDKNKFRLILRNFRPERALFYLSFLFMGMGLAFILGRGVLFSWVDGLAIISLVMSWISLWMYAVHVNDVADVKIDKISNMDRPLSQNLMTENEMREAGYIWLALALLGSWAAGFYPFFFSLIFVAVSYAYSAPPFRFKRVPVLASFLLSLICLVNALAGFFFLSVDKAVQSFPMALAVGILVMITLGINIRDMKDVEGDREEGIVTLPVLFGQNGPRVVGICLALSFLVSPFFLASRWVYFIAVPAAIIGYWLVVRKPFREKPIFYLYFVYILIIVSGIVSVYIF
jgi:4-hydroxybenzoate polyprenyltransferase